MTGESQVEEPRTEDDETVRADMTGIERRLLHDVIGSRVPIAATKTNGDAWLERNPAAIALLDQIAAACAERDAEMAEYTKAKPISERASSKTMRHFQGVRNANDRALQLRTVLDALRNVPGVLRQPQEAKDTRGAGGDE